MRKNIHVHTVNPVHEHDCYGCQYIATVHEIDNHPHIYDCYWCERGFPTIIARYSSDGPDYLSGLLSAQRGHRILTLALELGISRGIVDPKYRQEIK